MHVAACFCFAAPLDIQQEEKDAKKVSDGHGRSFGFWPWQKVLDILFSVIQSYKKIMIILPPFA